MKAHIMSEYVSRFRDGIRGLELCANLCVCVRERESERVCERVYECESECEYECVYLSMCV